VATIKNILGEISGKIGGLVFTKNKTSNVIRRWTKPTKASSQKLNSARASISTITKKYSTLTDLLKSQWSAFAISYYKPKKIKVGVTYSGYNAYVGLKNTVLYCIKNIRATELELTGACSSTSSIATLNISLDLLLIKRIFPDLSD
jgi:hypothetical protein